MSRNFLCVCLLGGALTIAGCSRAPQTPLSPTGSDPASTAVNPDGSTMKVSPPRDVGPGGGVIVNTLRPTITWTPATALFQAMPLGYEVEVQNALGTVVYSRRDQDSPHQLQQDLTHSDNYWVRVRVQNGNDIGPWSDFAQFRTFDPPAPPPPPGPTPPTPGSLPFPVPAICTAGNGPACGAELTGTPLVANWWAACRGGSGTNCHRFVRAWAASLATGDPNWGLITKNPGEQQCTWDGCGPGNGTGYGEDIVAYHTGGGGWFGYDTVVGAGAPGANLNWALITVARPGNVWAPVPPFPPQ